METLPLRLQQIFIQFVPFIMAVVFHEFSHGWVANYWGDHTAKESGRLTLNPVPHLDPLGTVLFPLVVMLTGLNFLIGWAKPVPIDPRRFRKFRKGLFFVSMAGIGMNILLAILSAISVCALTKWAPHDFYLFEPLLRMSVFSISINFMLAVFNLIPIPPLDGSKALESILPFNAARKFESLARYGMLIMWGLLLTGTLSYLMYPVQLASDVTLISVARLFGISEI